MDVASTSRAHQRTSATASAIDSAHRPIGPIGSEISPGPISPDSAIGSAIAIGSISPDSCGVETSRAQQPGLLRREYRRGGGRHS